MLFPGIVKDNMDYLAWNKGFLKRVVIRDGSKSTSVWCTEESEKPLVILVHGISGDHIGMVPLACELANSYRVAIVDLPGHGKSDPIPLPDGASLQKWFASTLKSIEQKLGAPEFICAHSFGCSAVLGKEVVLSHKVILLNPVPTPSDIYGRYARIIMSSAHFWAPIYNWRVLIYLRGTALIKLRTRDAKRRVRWAGWHSRANPKQIIFQAGLVDMILDGSAYQYAGSGKVAAVICGIADTTACQRDSLDMHAVFGSSNIIFLRGGHLLPIESPARVADVIKEAMIH